MKRRSFIELLAAGSTVALAAPCFGDVPTVPYELARTGPEGSAIAVDLVIIGGGLGGVAAALGALRNGLTVILTEETEWIGGQMTQQGVPPDEHQWIETHGATAQYRKVRQAIRDYYARNYPLTPAARARKHFNPGDGAVSRLCHEPKVALAVLMEMLEPYRSANKLVLLLEYKIASAKVAGNKVRSVLVKSRQGNTRELKSSYFVDATELGDVLAHTGTEFVTGTESIKETGELHAPEKGDPESVQAFTMCFAMDYLAGESHLIEKPREYSFWRAFIPPLEPAWSGKMLDLSYSDPKTLQPKMLGFHPEGKKTGESLNLWLYRRMISKDNFEPGFYRSDITLVNWPQNDYLLGNLIGASEKEFSKQVERAKQQSLSLLYWLQTEAPRPDGGKGWPGLRLRKDVFDTEDGFAKYPYIRESRRIKAVFTVTEQHVGKENRALLGAGSIEGKAADFYDSVGVGYYHIDLHPSTGGTNYVDFSSCPFQIPLGALLPIRMENLLPANKNIGTTHITNGCFRLHPVEWSIGEAVGMLASFALKGKILPRKVREDKQMLTAFQSWIHTQGIETDWPAETFTREG